PGVVLGVARVGGTAPGGVDPGLDRRPDRARSVLHPAGAQHRGDVGDAEADPDAGHGSDAAQDDADDAAGVRRDDGVLPGRPGAVLGHQRHAWPGAAVVEHPPLRRPAGRREEGLTPTRVDAADTIVAVATPAGAGGVGIVRLSGPRSRAIGEALA